SRFQLTKSIFRSGSEQSCFVHHTGLTGGLSNDTFQLCFL
ncbi:hypothetical protein HOLDEFILI_00727, partial [Holdemania filiformis DSM 12042]